MAWRAPCAFRAEMAHADVAEDVVDRLVGQHRHVEHREVPLQPVGGRAADFPTPHVAER